MPQAEGPRRPNLLDQVRAAIRARHYSRRTERAYAGWIRRFIVWTDRRVAPSTQNQALSAILFLYREVLELDLPWL